MTTQFKFDSENAMAFLLGVAICLLMFFSFGCGNGNNAEIQNYDSLLNAQHDSLLNAINAETDTYHAPSVNIATQMKIEGNFDTLSK